MIQCQSCKAHNPPSQTNCQNCGADLLPGIGRGNRIAVVVLGVFAALLLGVPGILALRSPASASASEPGRCIVTFLLLGAAVIASIALLGALRKTPQWLRYRMRARRHVSIDPEQAFADFTKAVEHNSSDLESWKARGLLYDKLDLAPQALEDEIGLLTGMSGAMTKRKEQLKGELAQQAVRLYEKLIHGHETTGETQEAIRARLRLLDFIEGNVSSLVQPKTDMLTAFEDSLQRFGESLAIRHDVKKQVREARQNMARAGLIRAVGRCPMCRQWVVAGPDLQCPNYETHKQLTDIRYVMPDEADRAIGELRSKS